MIESLNSHNSWHLENRLSYLNPYSSLKERISHISQKNIIIPLNEREIADIKNAIYLSNTYFLSSLSGIKSELSKVSEAQIKQVLMHLTEKEDVAAFLKAYIDLLDDSSLMDLLKFSEEAAVTDAIFTQVLLKDDALKSSALKEGWVIFNEIQTAFIAFSYRMLEMFISITGFNDLQREPEEYENNMYAARGRAQLFMEILGSPRILFEFFSIYISFVPAITLTSLALFLVPAAILIYLKYFKKCPQTCRGLDNLKKLAAANKEPLYVRPGVLNRIKSAFLSGKGVLLVGKSGAGKTSIVDSLSLEVLEGRCQFPVNPEMFGTNASRFTSLKNQTSFEGIENRFESHPNEVIFFFDEFASFFNGEGFEGTSTANEIKTFLGRYKYVIGATTTLEYDKFIKNNKTIGGRRFIVIHLDEILGKELENALYHYLHEKNPEIALEAGVIAHIAKVAKDFNPDTSTIDAAISLLKLSLGKISDLSFEQDDEELSRLEAEYAYLKNLLSHEKVLDKHKEFKLLTEEIQVKSAKKNDKIELLKTIKKIELSYLKIKKKSFQIANNDVDPNVKREWLKNEALVYMMDTFIQNKRKELGLFPCLNKDLIDSIIQENSGQVEIKKPPEKKQVTLHKYFKKALRV